SGTEWPGCRTRACGQKHVECAPEDHRSAEPSRPAGVPRPRYRPCCRKHPPTLQHKPAPACQGPVQSREVTPVRRAHESPPLVVQKRPAPKTNCRPAPSSTERANFPVSACARPTAEAHVPRSIPCAALVSLKAVNCCSCTESRVRC